MGLPGTGPLLRAPSASGDPGKSGWSSDGASHAAHALACNIYLAMPGETEMVNYVQQSIASWWIDNYMPFTCVARYQTAPAVPRKAGWRSEGRVKCMKV